MAFSALSRSCCDCERAKCARTWSYSRSSELLSVPRRLAWAIVRGSPFINGSLVQKGVHCAGLSELRVYAHRRMDGIKKSLGYRSAVLFRRLKALRRGRRAAPTEPFAAPDGGCDVGLSGSE